MTLSSLTLEGIWELDFYYLLRHFPSLETLVLRYVDFAESYPQVDNPFSSLKHLELVDASIFSSTWAETLRFPQLALLYYDNDVTEVFKTFVASHPSLEVLDCDTNQEDLIFFADALPQLHSIFISSSYDVISNWRMFGLRNVPFPFLRTIVLGCEEDYSLQDFENIVRSRCLPMEHSLSRLEHPSVPVELRLVTEEGRTEDAL